MLSLVSKLFERCIYNQLIEHVYGGIYERTAVRFSQRQFNNIEAENLQYLDFAKAFVTVNRNLLLVKFHNLVLEKIFFVGSEISFLGDSKESLRLVLHQNQSLDHVDS